jgi:hypothetical protein
MRQEGGDMDEITSPCARKEFSSGTPADITDAGKNECDRILIAMVVNAGACRWADFE